MIGVGALAAYLSYLANGRLMGVFDLEYSVYARTIAPPLEEIIKALVLVYLFYSGRIAFLVDAALLGFAIGAGFAVVENAWFLYILESNNPSVWIVRGFGTALMHGGATALVAVIAQTLRETRDWPLPLALLPALGVASAIHLAFNSLLFTPIYATLATVVLLPPLMYWIYHLGSRSVHHWLESDFDADADLLAQLESGQFEHTPAGQYMQQLSDHFEPLVMVDMLCYIRLYTELSMRAKGLVLMRQHGLDLPPDDSIEPKFRELGYLEKSIGRTGMLAIDPLLEFDSRDLWHLNALEGETGD